MKNILFISEHFNMAGTETFMLNVVRASDKTQYHYDFLIFRPSDNNYREEAEELGCHFYILPPRFKSPTLYLKSLDTFFKCHAKKYVAVHWCGGAISSIAPLWYAHKYKIHNIIVHSHNSSCTGLHTRLLHSVFKHMLPKYCNHFFACSTSAAKFFFGKKDAVIIKNGIDLKKYRFNKDIRKQYRDDFGIDSETFVLGHIGRFEEVKNHSFLLEVFIETLKKRENSALFLIGKGSLEESIRERVRHMGIEKKVLFMGERDDVDKCVQAMDIFVMPSLYEGLPFVLVEAQAAGLPCVISDTINDDAVICPSTFKLPLSQKAENWAKKILDILEKYIRIDTSNYLIEKGFSIRNTTDYLEKIYSSKTI